MRSCFGTFSFASWKAFSRTVLRGVDVRSWMVKVRESYCAGRARVLCTCDDTRRQTRQAFCSPPVLLVALR